MTPEVTHHPVGERANGLAPGDIILVHGLTLVPRMIRYGQQLRFRGARAPYAYWNHAAVYVGDIQLLGDSGAVPYLIEAKGRCPVRMVPLAQYDVRHYAVVRWPGDTPELLRANAVKFCRAKLGNGYGYLTILSLVGWSLTGGNLTVGLGSSFICSGLAAEASERFGVVYARDPDAMTPAHLAEHYGIKP